MEEQYYISIKEKLIKSEIYDRAKDYSKYRHKVKIDSVVVKIEFDLWCCLS